MQWCWKNPCKQYQEQMTINLILFFGIRVKRTCWTILWRLFISSRIVLIDKEQSNWEWKLTSSSLTHQHRIDEMIRQEENWPLEPDNYFSVVMIIFTFYRTSFYDDSVFIFTSNRMKPWWTLRLWSTFFVNSSNSDTWIWVLFLDWSTFSCFFLYS